MSKVTVDMNPYTKQYDRNCTDTTSDLVVVERSFMGKNDDISKHLDWDHCERHVGALVLRGNRCVLVRSLHKEWEGMQLPSFPFDPTANNQQETPVDAAVWAVTKYIQVDPSEVLPLPLIPPVTVYAPNNQPILMYLYPFYAVEPPPDGLLEDQGMEDDETPYDWYTFPNIISKLDRRSIAALHTMALALMEAANVGILPAKWGGVFGQELGIHMVRMANDNKDCIINPSDDHFDPFELTAPVEDWTPSRKADILQDVRKANMDLMHRISSRRMSRNDTPGPLKLSVTLLSGFLGSGKTVSSKVNCAKIDCSSSKRHCMCNFVFAVKI